MNKEPCNINSLIKNLTAISFEPRLSNQVWQNYSFNKMPERGNIWYRLFPKKFKLENLIGKELLMMSLLDVLNGIKKSNNNLEDKVLILLGVIDQFISVVKIYFPTNIFMEEFFLTYDLYLNSGKEEVCSSIILNNQKTLNKKDFAIFMIGTIKTTYLSGNENFLLNTDLIKNLVERQFTEDKLDLYMSDEQSKKYVDLLKSLFNNN